jgi:hypothetical protein
MQPAKTSGNFSGQRSWPSASTDRMLTEYTRPGGQAAERDSQPQAPYPAPLA